MQWIGKARRHDAPACPAGPAAAPRALGDEPLGSRLLIECATMGPIGRTRFMPGTWGSAAAALLAPWLFLPLPMSGRLLLLAAIFAFGGWAAKRAEGFYGRPDPGSVVIDELLGQWVALLPLSDPASTSAILLAFVLFRVFDIAKPFPVCWSETCLPHGYGIMIDDVVAALYAAIGIVLLRILGVPL